MKKIEYTIIKPSNNLKLKDMVRNVFICIYELYKTINKINYFKYHIGRCKKTEDIVKLSIKLAGLIFYSCSVMRIIKETLIELKNI